MSHIIRKTSWDTAFAAEKDLPSDARVTAPTNVRFAHVDQSPDGAYSRLQIHFPDEAEKLSKTRWAIINVWRPILPINRDALAMCDACSIPDERLRKVIAYFPKPSTEAGEAEKQKSEEQRSALDRAYGAVGQPPRPPNEAFEILPPEGDEYKWYYASQMRPDEALLLKIFDSSARPEVAKRSPHTSFIGPEDFGGPRTSLECRCLVFWEDEVVG
jgi:hypothetical protein